MTDVSSGEIQLSGAIQPQPPGWPEEVPYLVPVYPQEEETREIPDADELDETEIPRKPAITVIPGDDNAVYGVSALPDSLVTLPDDAPDTYEESLECPWLTSEQRLLLAKRDSVRAGQAAAERVDAWFDKHLSPWDWPPARTTVSTELLASEVTSQ